MITLYELQRSVQESETRINQGVDALYQFLSDGIASDALITRSSLSIDKAKSMDQMAVAMNKLSTLEGYVTQVYVNNKSIFINYFSPHLIYAG